MIIYSFLATRVTPSTATTEASTIPTSSNDVARGKIRTSPITSFLEDITTRFHKICLSIFHLLSLMRSCIFVGGSFKGKTNLFDNAILLSRANPLVILEYKSV